MAIRVKDLKNQTGEPGPHPFLKCIGTCQGEYSANAGDYFAASPDTVLKCCGKSMRLVRRETRLVEVQA